MLKKILFMLLLTASAFAWQDHNHDHSHDHKKEAQTPPQRAVIELDPMMLKDYVGVYFWTPHKNHIKVTLEDGKLYGQPETKDKNRLLPVDVDEFIIEGVGAELNFVRSDEGMITAMILLENNELQEAPKLTKEQQASCTSERHTHDFPKAKTEEAPKKSE